MDTENTKNVGHNLNAYPVEVDAFANLKKAPTSMELLNAAMAWKANELNNVAQKEMPDALIDAYNSFLSTGRQTGKESLKGVLRQMIDAKLKGDIEKLENMPQEAKAVTKTIAEWDKIVNAQKKRQRKAVRGW